MDDVRLERIERRMDELDQRSSAMERAMDGAMQRSRAAVNTMIPSDTRKHMRAAWRENLLAVRSMLDYWADRLEDDGTGSGSPADAAPTTRETGRQNIPID
jgi:hypothetical protein